MVPDWLEIFPVVSLLHRSSNHRVASSLSATPVVSRGEMFRLSQPCDIILTITPDNFLTSWVRRAGNHLLRLILTTPFTSSKLYLGNDRLAGFGLNGKGQKSVIRTVSYRKYLGLAQSACLLRVPGLNGSHQERISNFVHERLGSAYDLRLVVRSFFQRAAWVCWHKRRTLSLERRRLFRTDVPYHTCSTLISAAFFQAGILFRPDPTLVWPIDFFLSPLVSPVCQLRRGSR